MAGTGGIQVLRFETRRTLDIHLVRHIEGQRRHATTRASATIDGGSACVDLGGVGLAAARAAVERHWPNGRGRKPHQALDMVFAGAPPYLIPVRDVDGKVVTKEDQDGVPRPMYQPNPDQWSPEREREWANSVAATLPELVGDESVVASVSLHRDELSAHVQAVVVPVRGGKLGWCRVRDAAAARLAPQVKEAREKAVGRGEDAPKLSTRTRYGVLQDALYYRVSRQFGLSRGQVGSEATHVEIDRAAAAEAREGQALYEAEQARVAATEAAADADASRRTRNEYHDEAVENVAAAREARQERAASERERDTARTERDRAVGDLEAFRARGPWVRRVHQERELRQREQTDAERRAELDHKESELNEREEQVAKDAADAATAAADVERREADLATGKTRLEEDRAAMATERRKADEARETADAVFRTAARQREKAEGLELEVQDDLKELTRREAKLAAEREAFEPARRKLKEEEEQGRRRREEQDEELRRRREELGKVKDEEKTWRPKVAGLKAQVEEWGRQLAEAREELKRVLERVGSLQRREEAVLGLEERKEGLDAKDRELEEREQRVKSREADANEKERNIGSREAKVSEREDAVVGLKKREDAAKTLAANGQQALGKAREVLAESDERVRQADALYAGSEGHHIVTGAAKWLEKKLGNEVRDEFLRKIAPEDPELTQRASTPMVVESSLAPRPGYSRTAPATQCDNDPSGRF